MPSRRGVDTINVTYVSDKSYSKIGIEILDSDMSDFPKVLFSTNTMKEYKIKDEKRNFGFCEIGNGVKIYLNIILFTCKKWGSEIRLYRYDNDKYLHILLSEEYIDNIKNGEGWDKVITIDVESLTLAITLVNDHEEELVL